MSMGFLWILACPSFRIEVWQMSHVGTNASVARMQAWHECKGGTNADAARALGGGWRQRNGAAHEQCGRNGQTVHFSVVVVIGSGSIALRPNAIVGRVARLTHWSCRANGRFIGVGVAPCLVICSARDGFETARGPYR